MNVEEGEYLVNLARKSLFSSPELKGKVKGKKGVFVTLHSYPSNELRGCIGFVNPVEIEKGIVDAARAAAFNDLRFGPLGKEEEVVIEVSILTEPSLIERPYEDSVEIGKDGLILEYHRVSGLLLPNVAIEQKWDVKKFLDGICIKAGLPPDVLMKRDCRLYNFQTEIFCEESPGGKVYKR